MNKDINNNFIFNDLSIDRNAYRKVVKIIKGTRWTVDNRGVVYNSRGAAIPTESIWDGSVRVQIAKGGTYEREWVYVNSLVLNAFVGPPPTSKHVPWHRDGDRSNNKSDNLTWVVLKEEREYG